MWTEGLTVEIKLRFQIPPAWRGRGFISLTLGIQLKQMLEINPDQVKQLILFKLLQEKSKDKTVSLRFRP